MVTHGCCHAFARLVVIKISSAVHHAVSLCSHRSRERAGKHALLYHAAADIPPHHAATSQNFAASSRAFSTASPLVQRLQELVPEKQAEMKDLKAKYSDKKLGEVTVAQVS